MLHIFFLGIIFKAANVAFVPQAFEGFFIQWLRSMEDKYTAMGAGFFKGGGKGFCPPPEVVSFPDPAFTKDKGLAHIARNLGLPDLAGEE